MKIQVKMSGPK